MRAVHPRANLAALGVFALVASGCVGGAPQLPAVLPANPAPQVTSAPPLTNGTAEQSPSTTTSRGSGTTEAPTTSLQTSGTTASAAGVLALGQSGPGVLELQRELAALGYWLGTPNGVFGDSTQQAVYALQKAAGIAVDGIVGPETAKALAAGVDPTARSSSGNLIEVNLTKNLLLFVRDGRVLDVLNASTGGGYTYTVDGQTGVAATPVGTFRITWQQDGMLVNSLGELWRPKFFYSGFAIHGDSYVPPMPVSHGCVRVSNEAMDWIWQDDLAPIGTTVWVYW